MDINEFKSDPNQPIPFQKAAPYLGGISRPSLYKLVNNGDLETLKIGSRRYVTWAMIERCRARLTAQAKAK